MHNYMQSYFSYSRRAELLRRPAVSSVFSSTVEFTTAWQPLGVSAALVVADRVAEAKPAATETQILRGDACSLIIHKGVPSAGFPGNEDC